MSNLPVKKETKARDIIIDFLSDLIVTIIVKMKTPNKKEKEEK